MFGRKVQKRAGVVLTLVASSARWRTLAFALGRWRHQINPSNRRRQGSSFLYCWRDEGKSWVIYGGRRRKTQQSTKKFYFSSKNPHEMKWTVRDQKQFLICIHKALEEFPHVRTLMNVFLDVGAHNRMHHRMRWANSVLWKNEMGNLNNSHVCSEKYFGICKKSFRRRRFFRTSLSRTFAAEAFRLFKGYSGRNSSSGQIYGRTSPEKWRGAIIEAPTLTSLNSISGW